MLIMHAMFNRGRSLTTGRVDGWTDGRMVGWTDGRMVGWSDGRMDGCQSRKRTTAYNMAVTGGRTMFDRHWIIDNVSADYWIITALPPVYGSKSTLSLATGLPTTLPLIAGSTTGLPPNIECHRQHCRRPPCHRHFRQPNDCP